MTAEDAGQAQSPAQVGHLEPVPSVSGKRRSARNRVMDLLARRNHSELELRQKLGADFSADEIGKAIEFARESKWLLPPEELAEQVATTLARKHKGQLFINQYLKSKGLPAVAPINADEVERGIALVESKLARNFAQKTTQSRADEPLTLNYDEQRKIQRLLHNRGYADSTIRQVLQGLKKMRKSE